MTNENQNQPVAVETPVVNTNVAVITARKSMMGKWKKVGAPPKDIIGLSKNRKRGSFTKHDIFELNGRTISLLTIDKRLKALRKTDELVICAEKAQSEGPGRPAILWSFDKTKAQPKKTRKGKKAVTVPAETPAPTETPAPVPANTEVVTEVAQVPAIA